jgi:hypothetical protein
VNASNPAQLAVAPCFLPNKLAGPYWVVAAGNNPTDGTLEWAAVSGGAPTVAYPDGCTTSTDTTNGSGLWIFGRTPVLSADALAAARQALVLLGYTLSQLIDVPQAGCTYDGATIKS